MTAKTKHPVVRLERMIPAPAHEVYRAWLEPDLLRCWLAPGLEVKRVEVDERVSGYWRVWHTRAGMDAGGFECEILELVPDQRIVFRWGFVGPERGKGVVYDSLLTVTLRETSKGKTALTLVHERLDDLAAAMPDVADNVGAGWTMVLGKLAAVLASGTAADRQDARRGHGVPTQMKKPVFSETMQLGIVVRDLDAAMRRYVDDYGIGPWEVYQFKPGDVIDWRENGRPVEPSTRIATTMVGRVQWELIQPLDDKSIFAQFLAEKGEGVHHIAVAAENFEETLGAEAERGNELVLSCELSGEFSGIKVAYLGTQRDLGVIIEVFSGTPGTERKPDAT